MFNIRPFEPTDAGYEAFATMHRSIWPDLPDTAEELRHWDESLDSQILFRRFVVQVDGKMVAIGEYGETWWSMKPGKYFLKILVHPDYRRRGIGTALREYLWGFVREHNPVLLTATTREDQADGMRLLAKYGFEQVTGVQS